MVEKTPQEARVFTDELVAQIARSLQPGGELRVASDVEEYFMLIQHLIAGLRSFQEQTSPSSRRPSIRSTTLPISSANIASRGGRFSVPIID